MATNDERNFRSSYYEKVGFRSVEEKKSLEILLKEKSLDKAKLNHFCLRFPVPGIHRSYLWKLLLGVLPLQVACHEYVWSCREQSFNDLARMMRVLKLETQSAPHNLVIMWLLETGGVPTGCKEPLKNNPINENFATLASMMMEFFDNDVEVYWVSKGFFNFLTRLAIEMPKLTECTHSFLEKEDSELYNYMLDKELLQNLPLFDWFTSMFAVVLNESSLCKVWDKMVGGSYKILIFVAVSLCVSLKKSIMSCDTSNNLNKIFENVTEEFSELVVNKGLDLWQQQSNLINIGLEFSVKHNPTALWAAQQVYSMPNLSVVGQNTSGFLERPFTMPDLSLHNEKSQSHSDHKLKLDFSVFSETDAAAYSPEAPAKHHTSGDGDRVASPIEQNNQVFLRHIDEMTRVLNEMRQTTYFSGTLQRRPSNDYDEPWMQKPERSVQFENESAIDKDTVVVDGFVETEMPSRDLMFRLLIVIGVNGLFAVIILVVCFMI
ncbi:TBC1 domain family member 7 [Neocloeon triangulifer]|uniref:TBC1 domain family member 7 n=1 Tax=Neocloeon triangulifer TaxID=2078957 RepID=UPI00286F3E27|nr:TBC1 domain family member 7 [Neocloeon triangulifer]